MVVQKAWTAGATCHAGLDGSARRAAALVASSAPKVALALGYDVNDFPGRSSSW